MRAFSDEYIKMKLDGKCPRCRNRHLLNLKKALNSWKLFDGQDQPLSRLTWSWPQGAYAVCQNCGYKLMVFEADKVQRPSLELVELLETHRSEERIGRDERLIDNSSSPAAVTRKLLVTREWSRDYKLEREASSRSSEGFTIGGEETARLSMEAEHMLKQRYTISENSRQAYTEEVTIVVPAGVRLRVHFDWKNLLQHGMLKVRDSSSQISSYKFQVVAGVTFDQSQVHVES